MGTKYFFKFLKILKDTIKYLSDLDKIYNKVAKFDKVKTENILLTSGIDGGIRVLFESFLNEKDKIAAQILLMQCMKFIQKFLKQN